MVIRYLITVPDLSVVYRRSLTHGHIFVWFHINLLSYFVREPHALAAFSLPKWPTPALEFIVGNQLKA